MEARFVLAELLWKMEGAPSTQRSHEQGEVGEGAKVDTERRMRRRAENEEEVRVRKWGEGEGSEKKERLKDSRRQKACRIREQAE